MLALTYCFIMLRGGQELPNSGTKWRHVGTMLAYVGAFFALGHFFFVFGRFWNASCSLFAHCYRFFRVFGRSGLDFAWPGSSFGAFETTFFDVFWCQPARITEILFMQQNHSFCDVFIDFGTCRTQLPNMFFA